MLIPYRVILEHQRVCFANRRVNSETDVIPSQEKIKIKIE